MEQRFRCDREKVVIGIMTEGITKVIGKNFVLPDEAVAVGDLAGNLVKSSAFESLMLAG